MKGIEIFIPVLAHMLLVIGLYFLLAIRKTKAIKNRTVDRKETALDNKAWTEDVIKLSNNIANQFETPIMFYILAVLTFLIGLVDTFSLVIMWAYVISRCIHVYVHIGSNYVPTRMKVFALGLLLLLVMLMRLLVTLVAGF